MRTTIVIPTYNERENLRTLVEQIAAVAALPLSLPLQTGRGEKMEWTVLVVDDASPDGTGALAEALAREYGPTPSRSPSRREGEKIKNNFPTSLWEGGRGGVAIRVLHRPRKEGLGAAYVAGFQGALTDGADVVVQMDADGSHDPEEIPRMIAALLSLSSLRGRSRSNLTPYINETDEIASSPPAPRNDTSGGCDLVIGSRRVSGGRTIGWGWHRRLASWTAQSLSRHLLGLHTKDVTSGFRAWRAQALRGVLGEHSNDSNRIRMIQMSSAHSRHSNPYSQHSNVPLSSGYAFQVELLHRAEQLGLRIAEHSITFRDRERGSSKLGLRDIFGFFRTLARLWITDHDRRFTLWVGLSLIFLAGLPYLYGWWNTPPGDTFTGIHALSSGDMAVYGSYIEQVREGRWTFVDLFTSEWPQRPRFDIFWLTAGLFARATHLSAPVAFHVLRLLIIIPFTLFLATFVAAFFRSQKMTPGVIFGFPSRTVRRTALLFLAFSSGVGAYLAPAFETRAFWRPGYEHWPMDLWVAESNTFLTLFQSPHFIVSLWLLLFILLVTLRFAVQREECERVTWSGPMAIGPPRASHEHGGGAQRQDPRAFRLSIFAGVASLALFQFHPFYVPTVMAVLTAWAFIECLTAQRVRWDVIRHVAIVGLISAPSVVYHLMSLSVDPIAAAKAQQNLLLTPAWWLVFVSYGFLIPLAIGGAWHLLRQRSSEARILIVWLGVTLILISSPLTWQRRLTEGLHVVIVLIAIVGLFPLLTWLKPKLPAWVRRYAWGPLTATIIAVPLLGVSTLFNIFRDVALYALRYPRVVPRNSIYYPTAAVDAMHWIRAHAALGEVTFAVGLDGNFLPMYTARQVVFGHGVETTNFVEKYHTSYALTRGQLTSEASRAFFTRVRAHYILVTDASRNLWVIDPRTIPGTTLVYRNGGAEVYQWTNGE